MKKEGKWSVLKWDSGTAQSPYCLLHWHIMLYLIFHFKVNGAVNDSWFPAVDGGSSAASTWETPRGPLQSTTVNGSYFHPVTGPCSCHRAGAVRDRVTIFWPYDPVKATIIHILMHKMMLFVHVLFFFHISTSYPGYFRVCVRWWGVTLSGTKMLIKSFVAFRSFTLEKMSATHWCETTLNTAPYMYKIMCDWDKCLSFCIVINMLLKMHVALTKHKYY